MITIYFINLEREAERRESIEKNLAEWLTPELAVRRIVAIDGRESADIQVPGKLRDAEKACFMSHRKALETSLGDDHDALVLEDDAVFGPSTSKMLLRLAESDKPPCDLIFTDICVPDIENMIKLFRIRRELMKIMKVNLINLSGLNFAGATAYFIRKGSKRKLYELLNQVAVYDIPYDLFLRRLVHGGKVLGYTAFPFLTTLSSCFPKSQIQLTRDQANNLAWDAFRRIVWIDAERGGGDPLAPLKDVSQDFYDVSANRFSTVLRFMLSERFNA